MKRLVCSGLRDSSKSDFPSLKTRQVRARSVKVGSLVFGPVLVSAFENVDA